MLVALMMTPAMVALVAERRFEFLTNVLESSVPPGVPSGAYADLRPAGWVRWRTAP